MFFFGHIGITVGLAYVAGHIPARTERLPSGERSNSIQSIIRNVDMRVVIVGSVLPDIIDKPVGEFLFKDTFSNGRIFSHSLLFFILLTLIGLALYKTRRMTWMLALAFGTFVHLILDQMWLAPESLLWPSYGWAFPRENTSNWIPQVLHGVIANPSVYIPEIIGIVIMVLVTIRLLQKGTFMVFLKHGRL